MEAFRDVHRKFSAEDAQWIKDKERVTNHDVKAVEYFVKEAMETLGVGLGKSLCTSGSPLRTSTTPRAIVVEAGHRTGPFAAPGCDH